MSAPEQSDDLSRLIELERADAARRALEGAIKRIEQLDGNELYQKAWKASVQAIRAMLARS